MLGAVGVALGALPAGLSALGWSGPVDAFGDAFAQLPISSATYIYVFLPLLVFEAGIATDVRRMMEDAAPILLLAIIATLVAVFPRLVAYPMAAIAMWIAMALFYRSYRVRRAEKLEHRARTSVWPARD